MQTIRRRREKESRRQDRESSNPQKEGHKVVQTGKSSKLSTEGGTRKCRQEREASYPQKEGQEKP